MAMETFRNEDGSVYGNYTKARWDNMQNAVAARVRKEEEGIKRISSQKEQAEKRAHAARLAMLQAEEQRQGRSLEQITAKRIQLEQKFHNETVKHLTEGTLRQQIAAVEQLNRKRVDLERQYTALQVRDITEIQNKQQELTRQIETRKALGVDFSDLEKELELVTQIYHQSVSFEQELRELKFRNVTELAEYTADLETRRRTLALSAEEEKLKKLRQMQFEGIDAVIKKSIEGNRAVTEEEIKQLLIINGLRADSKSTEGRQNIAHMQQIVEEMRAVSIAQQEVDTKTKELAESRRLWENQGKKALADTEVAYYKNLTLPEKIDYGREIVESLRTHLNESASYVLSQNKDAGSILERIIATQTIQDSDRAEFSSVTGGDAVLMRLFEDFDRTLLSLQMSTVEQSRDKKEKALIELGSRYSSIDTDRSKMTPLSVEAQGLMIEQQSSYLRSVADESAKVLRELREKQAMGDQSVTDDMLAIAQATAQHDEELAKQKEQEYQNLKSQTEMLNSVASIYQNLDPTSFNKEQSAILARSVADESAKVFRELREKQAMGDQSVTDDMLRAAQQKAQSDAREASKAERAAQDEKMVKDLKNKSDGLYGHGFFNPQFLNPQQMAQTTREKANAYEQRYYDLRDKAGDGEVSAEELEQARKEAIAADLQAKATEALAKTMTALTDSIDRAIETAGQYQSYVNTRLQGTEKTYESISKMMRKNLTSSLVVAQADMIKNVKQLVDDGVAYNIEQRAYLMTVADKVATTFEANNETLLRLIRLQQADSTAARLGLEVTLTEFLNQMFEDTSYLTEGISDSVSAAILDANALMTRDQSLSFEYIVQKWMGSLSALGLSNETVSNLATGIGYLGTGNVQALAGNESLQNLLVMSANKAGLDYAEILIKGLDASSTNKLLQAMVGYLQEIASNDNKVVKSALSEVFDVSVSDLRAISSLTQQDISNIYSSNLGYGDAHSKAVSGIRSAGSRMSMTEKVDTLFDNFLYTTGSSIADNPVTNLTWKINSLIQDATGGINLPFINAFGSGLDLNTNINDLIKLGIVGMGTLSALGGLISSIGGSASTTGLTGWGAKDYTSRGSGFTASSGVSSGTSSSSYVGTGSSSDMYKSSVASGTSDAEETGEITNAGSKDDKNINDVYKKLFDEKATLNVSVADVSDSFISKLSKAIASATAGILTTGKSGQTLEDLIKKIMTDELDVNITNDYFDTWLTNMMIPRD